MAEQEKLPIPVWAWVFAVACGIIPFLTLGGAIPGAIGIGGAAGCIAIARDPKKSLSTRVAICVGITFFCWVLLVAVLGGIAMLR